MNTNIASATGTAVGALKNLKAGLANVRNAAPSSGMEGILKLGKDGKWNYGAGNLEIEPGSRWAVNPLSLKHGWICWKVIPEGSKDTPEKLGEDMVSMFETKPLLSELPDYGHPWAECISFNLKCLDGEDKDEEVIYNPTSKGSRKTIDDLLGAIINREDESTPVPIVVLKSDHYQHKTWGKTYFPIIEVVDWMGMDGAGSAEAPKEEPKQAAPQEATRRRGAAAPAPEPEVEDEQDEPVTATQEAAPAGEVRRRRRG